MDRKLLTTRPPRRGPNAARGLVLAVLALAAAWPPAAAAQGRDKTPEEEDLERAGRIASQPVRDVGIAKGRIPLVLQEAVDRPYAPPRRQDCRWLAYELARLDQALGPDFDVDDKSEEDKVEQIAFAGGEMIVNSLIPFRGLVREISGAAPADRRKAAAINAGLARRGYIRGLAAAARCPQSVTTAAR